MFVHHILLVNFIDYNVVRVISATRFESTFLLHSANKLQERNGIWMEYFVQLSNIKIEQSIFSLPYSALFDRCYILFSHKAFQISMTVAEQENGSGYK